jgi:CheY-like chemotaxis protein
LVVDDDTDGRELIELLFARKGATAKSARSVAEAFAHMEDFKPDLIVSDIGMPGEDGYSLIRRLRASDSPAANVPAIALTGFARDDDGQMALNAGFHAHVCKPVQPAQLLALVERLLTQA